MGLRLVLARHDPSEETPVNTTEKAIALADAVMRSIPDVDVALEVIENDRLGNQTALFAMTAGIGEVTDEVRSQTIAVLRSRVAHPDPFEGF